MRALKRKLMSRRGASITFALLLFLVCAIISSVVIVAGTAAGGRLSQMAQMDQRYYAVNSAAELVKNVLEEQAATITLTTTTTQTVTDSGAPVGAASTVKTIDVDGTSVSGGSEIPPGDRVFINVAKALSEAVNAYNAFNDLTPYTYTPTPINLTATGTVESLNTTPLNVTLTFQQPANGKMEVEVCNTDVTKGIYKLSLTFAFDIATANDTQIQYGTPSPIIDYDDDGNPIVVGYHIPKTIIDKQTEVFSCKLIGIRTGSAAASTP